MRERLKTFFVAGSAGEAHPEARGRVLPGVRGQEAEDRGGDPEPHQAGAGDQHGGRTRRRGGRERFPGPAPRRSRLSTGRGI